MKAKTLPVFIIFDISEFDTLKASRSNQVLPLLQFLTIRSLLLFFTQFHYGIEFERLKRQEENIMEIKVKVAVIGAGSAGLYALSQVRKKTEDFILINSGPLGTTCARVGCMPSKALIQAGKDAYYNDISEKMEGDKDAALEKVRRQRDSFVSGLIKSSIDPIRDRFIDGHARFVDAGTLAVNDKTIKAERIIIATGSRPIIPKPWLEFEDFILTSDNIFEQDRLPASLAAIGLGSQGLELGQALHRLGVELTGIEELETLAGLNDPEVNKKAVEIFSDEFPLWLGETAEVKKENNKLRVSAGNKTVLVEKILASLGRQPNVDDLGIENLGVELNEAGIPGFNRHTMQVGNLPVFIAGDVNARRPILHEAADEGRIAGFNAVHNRTIAFRRKPFFSLTFCEPDIVEVGTLYDELDREHTVIGEFNLESSGRATIMNQKHGIIRVYGQKGSGLLLGGALVSTRGEHLGHLLAWAIQQQLTAADLLKMPYYHPTMEESLQGALNDLFKKSGSFSAGLKELEILEEE